MNSYNYLNDISVSDIKYYIQNYPNSRHKDIWKSEDGRELSDWEMIEKIGLDNFIQYSNNVRNDLSSVLNKTKDKMRTLLYDIISRDYPYDPKYISGIKIDNPDCLIELDQKVLSEKLYLASEEQLTTCVSDSAEKVKHFYCIKALLSQIYEKGSLHGKEWIHKTRPDFDFFLSLECVHNYAIGYVIGHFKKIAKATLSETYSLSVDESSASPLIPIAIDICEKTNNIENIKDREDTQYKMVEDLLYTYNV